MLNLISAYSTPLCLPLKQASKRQPRIFRLRTPRKFVYFQSCGIRQIILPALPQVTSNDIPYFGLAQIRVTLKSDPVRYFSGVTLDMHDLNQACLFNVSAAYQLQQIWS